MQTLKFPSAKTAWLFTEEAQAQGYHARIPATVQILPRVTVWAVVIGGLAGGALLGSVGGLAEAGVIGLPRLEPLFAAPVGAVTALLATIGGSIGALIGGFVGLGQAPSLAERDTAEVLVREDGARLEELAAEFQAQPNGADAPGQHDMSTPGSGQTAKNSGATGEAMGKMGGLNLNRVLAWLVVVLAAGILLQATAYIWFLAMNYGHGADQQSRIGYTMKNVQRIPADTPEQTGAALAAILGGETLPAPADPLAAAVLAPPAAGQNQVLVYGGSQAAPDLATVRDLAAASNVAVVVADTEPAYAMPAAYAGAQFRTPVIPFSQAADVLAPSQERLILVAAPQRLLDDGQMATLAAYGHVERAADDNIYRHALLWARSRWGDFGWGIDEKTQVDGYFNFTLANPADPGFAAAGLPMAYLGNYGPLLYTPHDDLDELTDQYLWRVAPDYFAIPSDGPFMNVRVVGGPESVGYGAQARADLALETHSYRNHVVGAGGTAIAGWMWFFPGLVGFFWALFAMPRRLPDSGFYPRLYWPLAMLVLGPLGILAFYLAYQGRPLGKFKDKPAYLRPPWSQTVAATIMGMGVGMALMMVSMYLFEYFGMPVGTGVEFTPLQWLGAPMDAFMWVLMVVPAMIASTFLFMGPMQADMEGTGYWQGVRKAAPVVIISMAAASIGMFAFMYWTTNREELMTHEDLWLWVTPLWFAAACGFFTALIPNYLLVRRGWKMGGM